MWTSAKLWLFNRGSYTGTCWDPPCYRIRTVTFLQISIGIFFPTEKMVFLSHSSHRTRSRWLDTRVSWVWKFINSWKLALAPRAECPRELQRAYCRRHQLVVGVCPLPRRCSKCLQHTENKREQTMPIFLDFTIMWRLVGAHWMLTTPLPPQTVLPQEITTPASEVRGILSAQTVSPGTWEPANPPVNLSVLWCAIV